MAIEEVTLIDVLAWRPESASIECRWADVVRRDGVEIARRYIRHVVWPKDDVSDQHELIKRMAECYAAERAAAPAPEPEEA
jgi:hypothetical protein